MMAVARVYPDPVIVPLTDADMEAALIIQAQSFPIPWSERQIRDEMALRWSHVEVMKAPATSEVLGLAIWWTVGDELHLLNIAVATERRDEGFGRRLLSHVLARGAELGCREAILEVRAGNEGAVAFYERFGFEVVGRRPRYYPDNQEDALILTLQL